MPKLEHITKVLVIGSGPIIIGQAAEFDYAGTQACLALKEEGLHVVLVNNNPATIMTDRNIADTVYLEPLTVESLSKIIEKEKPDGLLPTLGGQTGLNLAVSLSEAGVLEKYNVELLGTPLDTIQKGEDRNIFKSMMKSINEPVPKSVSINTVEQAIQFATTVGYPIIVRPAFTLGGSGGGIAYNELELKTIVKNGIYASPISQVLVEQSVKGWKEIEYEVMRDENDTCIIVCNMENIDPVGVHTGDSIVVAPSQTLSDRQYQMLRSTSIKVIRALGVIGGCNIQFALHPDKDEYVIIEVNPRVSRSSALASKATGYPIARIAAKLALGYHLDEVINPITGHTFASFEPAIDYVAVKIPRWPFDKFSHANRSLGTQMKATGEVMALGRNFPSALQKAIRSLEISEQYNYTTFSHLGQSDLEQALKDPTDQRLFVLFEALRRGYSLEKMNALTEINFYFLHEFNHLVELEKNLIEKGWHALDINDLKKAKALGFSNHHLAFLLGVEENIIEAKLVQSALSPSYKMVDTCAGEFSAETPYFYSSWNEIDEVETLNGPKKIVVLGSGPIRIGQGVEFDYCSVHAAMSLREQNIKAIVINNNPETVSTDYSTADHLYFEPLTKEDVLHVVQKEKAQGVCIQFGGQTAINLGEGLERSGVKIMGTSIKAIDITEDRKQFYQLLKQLNIPHIPGETVDSIDQIRQVVTEIGYPVLIRPSYVIGGQGMHIISSNSELEQYVTWLQSQSSLTNVFPLLIDQFIKGTEVEIDVVCDGKDVIIPGIFEHIEKAGVHSGDSMAVFPAPTLSEKQKQTIAYFAKQISEQLHMKGIMNIQFVIDDQTAEIYCLEVNPRASRTVPIVSKVTGVPMIDLATRVQMGEKLTNKEWKLGLHHAPPFFVVKIPVFSNNKLPNVDPAIGPDMKSTGEAIGIGKTVQSALTKAFGWKNKVLPFTPTDKLFIALSEDEIDEPFLTNLKKINVVKYASPSTAKLLKDKGVESIQDISLHDAYVMCLDQQFQLIFSSNQDKSMEQITLREHVLKTDTPFFTSKETLLAYLKTVNCPIEEPFTMEELWESNRKVNKKKEGVLE
ncbi:carbamoyl-phosphate synthase large subunit [Salirhabdus euzebyi]|uniref:Carbamoyl phosphate synthase large chain n=1 Tax=Salirhabdus euzebyi TaxID=394506 RepID=A0A841PSG0_9BACI|nr:carbamoyl-phosphate synthase (glutamine-hydrolyzing) large subunit [Salirhabdus euzebyi]MBB6451877.1 carbamoyl-phosphate synthase large subunit [Salirhabdus euzebyi]